MTDDDTADRYPPRPAEGPDPADPEVAAAVARTRADLAAHGARTPAMPAGLLGDIDRALADERDSDTNDSSDTGVTGGGSRRRRLLAVAALAAAAAAAVVVGVVAAATSTGDDAPAPTAAPAPDAPRLSSGDGVSALRAGLGRSDYGPLAGRLDGCLEAHGVAPGTRPAGARQVVVDGRPGVLLVLPTGVAARLRLLVVEPGCGPGAPLTVSDTLVGR